MRARHLGGPLLWLGLALAPGPAAAAPAAGLVRVAAPDLGAPCDDLDAAALGAAIEQELPQLLEMPPEPVLRFGRRRLSPAEYARTTLGPLAKLARRGRAALCAALPRSFEFYRPAGAEQGQGQNQVKFTAYHHPVFRGSRRQGGAFQHPLYRRPADAALAQRKTAEILDGALAGKELELVWLDDATAALTAHIEGSARIELDEGGAVNLTTDGHNGWPYENVSRMVLRDGVLPKGLVAPPGMTRVRRWFMDHPEELRRYWGRNPHFVFFKETPLSGTGKFGELVPGRSAAVDPRHVPLGAALWLRSDGPAGQPAPEAPGRLGALRRIGLAQDVGAAILGPGRVDLFFGTGDEAQRAANALNRPGDVYVLLAAPPARRGAGKRRAGAAAKSSRERLTGGAGRGIDPA